jgi:hypothetical protein
MIFPKETYIAAEAEGGAGEWLTGKLDSYVEGMMDAVFAEDPALAVSAGDALATLTRTDMEVFCPGITPDIVSRMQSSPDVFAQGIGRNDALAGMLCVRAALGMLKGGAAVSKTFEPTIIDAANIGDDAVASMEAMDADSAALYNESWMDELRAYYAVWAVAAVTRGLFLLVKGGGWAGTYGWLPAGVVISACEYPLSDAGKQPEPARKRYTHAVPCRKL